MFILSLAIKSLRNRKFAVGLTTASIALSVALLLGVERVRRETRASFTNTVSGIDLVVGARTGPVQLLLYSVFRIGNATNNITWESVESISQRPEVQWTIPVSLGDSHQGYRVMGTTDAYFQHFRFARDRQLTFSQGDRFQDVFDVVLGAEVAAALGYEIGDSIVIAHGAGKVSFIEHDDKPFRVVGILAKTGTPVDRTLHVSLEGIEAIHIDWQNGAPIPGRAISAERARQMDLSPSQVTAVFIGLNSRVQAFGMQRFINEYPEEPLLAILPGVALQELWDLIGVAENGLAIVAGFVVLVGLLGMLTSLLTSLNERRREMAILRSVGARPLHIFALIVGESAVITCTGAIAGTLLLYGLLWVAQPIVAAQYGLFIAIGGLSAYECGLLGIVCLAGTAIGVIPGYRSYHYSLTDGMAMRL